MTSSSPEQPASARPFWGHLMTSAVFHLPRAQVQRADRGAVHRSVRADILGGSRAAVECLLCPTRAQRHSHGCDLRSGWCGADDCCR